jgi:hypothetical protein
VVAGDVRGEERLKSAEERNVRAYKVSECCLLSISLIFYFFALSINFNCIRLAKRLAAYKR